MVRTRAEVQHERAPDIFRIEPDDGFAGDRRGWRDGNRESQVVTERFYRLRALGR